MKMPPYGLKGSHYPRTSIYSKTSFLWRSFSEKEQFLAFSLFNKSKVIEIRAINA
jgi:hypothetical protein